MRPLVKIVLSVLLAGAVYLAFVLLPGLRPAYRELYRGMATSCFSEVGPEGTTRFRIPNSQDVRPANDPEEVMVDLTRTTTRYQVVTTEDDKQQQIPIVDGGSAKVVVPTGRIGYVPFVALIALTVAAPVPWRRRIQGLLIGGILINAFIMFRTWLMLLYFFSRPTSLQQYYWSGWTTDAVAELYEFFYVSPTCSFLVPVIIWAAVTLRPAELKASLMPDSVADDDSTQ
ncbi:MAG: hypothetical protein ACYTHJ_00180 [Planctomycetota bacterium]|jgi:hypothetical protein